MGNVLLGQYRKGDPAEGYERWLQQNPDLTSKQIHAENTLFRISSYKFNGRSIILKAFFKKQSAEVSEYIKMFQQFNREIEQHHIINIIPLRIINSRQNISFIVAYRQKMCQTLQDSITAKPSLNFIKKKWMIYQMIHAVFLIHRKFNFYHGHIRSSNFIVTSYGYVMLTDFAFYKPLYMFEDSEEGLPEFRLFYSSSTNNCTVAPEKMKESGEARKGKNRKQSPAKVHLSVRKTQENVSKFIPRQQNSNINIRISSQRQVDIQQINNVSNIQNLQKMDIFSLGCTILQILRNGKPTINYQGLLKLKKKEISLDHLIKQACEQIEQKQFIYELLKSMLAVDPDERPLIQQIQAKWNDIIDKEVYSLLFHCLSAFSTTSFYLPDLRICLIYSIFKFIEGQERNNHHQFKIKLPRSLQSLQALKIFKNIIKNKIIYVDEIIQGSILHKIINSADRQEIVDSEQQIMTNDDRRREFFVPQKLKRITSIRTSTSVIPKLQKILCPPLWDRDLMKLIEMKQKGMRLDLKQIRKNRFQDLLQEYKRSQFLRDMRKQECGNYYDKYVMIIRVIYSCIRGCKYNASKLIGIQLIMFISREISDSIKVQRILPYLISLLDDPDATMSKYVFNSLIDLFYLIVDPFQAEQEKSYYDLWLETIVNNIRTSRLRVTIFQRLSQIISICEWMQVHIRKICFTEPAFCYQKIIDAIKENYANFSQGQIRQLIINMPIMIWPDLFQFFVSFLNSEKILGLKKCIQITELQVEIYKKKFDIIDSCVESALDQNGLSLLYAIKYFTRRRLSTQLLAKKIAPMIIHPHLWVRQQAYEYISMCLQENPPTRIFFLFYEVFEPPFPLVIKDLENQYLLPQPLQYNNVDFGKKQLTSLTRKTGLTQNNFLLYLKSVKPSKSFFVTKEEEIQLWQSQVKDILDTKIEPIYFSQSIQKAANQLFQTNFLFYVGNTKSSFNLKWKQQEKKQAYFEFYQTIRKLRKFSLEDKSITQQKKDFFGSLLTLINTNFQKLLTKSIKIKEDENNAVNKVNVSKNIYLIMETLYKFEQFQIRQTTRLGEYVRKSIEPERLQRPKGQLITEIYEHKDVVTCLENIADHFLISGSYDGTVRIFNIKKMQMNITSDSEIAYEICSDQNQEKVKINTISAFENTSAFAVGTNKGQIRVFQVQKMPKKGYQMNKQPKSQNFQIIKYTVGGQIQKIVTFKNQKLNQCLCFITAQGILGVQDIRMKSKTVSCNLGKQRGMPRCLTLSTTGPSLLIGTLDGYILTYDIRCNIISNIRQLHYDQQPLTITGIYQSPHQSNSRPLFAVTYPSKHYQFSYFDLYDNGMQITPQKHLSSSDRQQILSIPTLVNKTKDQNFKLFHNSLAHKIYYKQLPDFNRNFKILDYLSDPFTIKESKIREVWMDRCKHRYNQIYSIYNKKSVPFIEHLQTGVLTNLNPSISNQSQMKGNKNLSLLIDKRQTKDYNEIQKIAQCRPTGSKIYSFPEQQNSDYLTCCSVFPNMIAVGGWDSVVKIYK